MQLSAAITSNSMGELEMPFGDTGRGTRTAVAGAALASSARGAGVSDKLSSPPLSEDCNGIPARPSSGSDVCRLKGRLEEFERLNFNVGT
eukprot:CAMPEP_0119315372 /NCGR_PEP_ID=MMETSP1333-20130426/35546_1 /TAXON_ID=418940 /ORGANISM="Scyphosphaera apsteinii, Strain RCC1455" /LENGTH=89 /DNA_ID=CAMNT_0007320713 /DNA_START=887 /DNA_END=1156 /DNA_ORIENTATION=+